MPDHFHGLISLEPQISVERAVQFIKGGFAFRAGKEVGFKSPVWQRGFSEARIFDAVGFARVREYIDGNPVRRGLALNPAEYAYSSANCAFELDDLPQRLKPRALEQSVATSEDVPDTTHIHRRILSRGVEFEFPSSNSRLIGRSFLMP